MTVRESVEEIGDIIKRVFEIIVSMPDDKDINLDTLPDSDEKEVLLFLEKHFKENKMEFTSTSLKKMMCKGETVVGYFEHNKEEIIKNALLML